MRVLFIIIPFLLISGLLFSQENELSYSRVKIDLTSTDVLEIAKLGLEADHGFYKKGKYLINDYSNIEIELLRDNGLDFTILIEDVQAFYVEQNHSHVDHDHVHGEDIQSRSLSDCLFGDVATKEYPTPKNYSYGSMGGYLTYDEALDELDKMVSLYPDLLSPRTAIDTILTHEGRSIYWMRLSDNANVEEDEPEVLYTALHHAREPNSLAQMIYYMWYLLENYESDSEVKYLVDNTEMYFIPIVNPDGYVYNGLTNPEGGGLWRKNRYAIDSTVVGVDLNRNYGYEWGFDNQGSSNNPGRDTYRGPSAFSEPETQAVRDFCNAHNFRIALNYHTFGNLLIYPWGFSDQPTDDHEIFVSFADLMTTENNYFAGTGTETVGYTVNGDSDDWMYGDTVSKPVIYSLTPESGSQLYGFWPPQDQIDAINKSNVYQNLMAAHLLLNYGEVEEIDAVSFVSEKENDLNVSIRKYGLSKGSLKLSVNSANNLVTFANNQVVQTDLNHLMEEAISYQYTVSDDIQFGDELVFVLVLDNGEYVKTDTIRKIYIEGTSRIVFEDSLSSGANWMSDNEWDITTSDFVSSPSSFTDSPNGNYNSRETTELILDTPLDLSLAKKATLTFNAKWAIETGYDYVQIMASNDGVVYTPLCGKYTKEGNGNQDFGNPLYDGIQEDWVLEEIDLSDYLGDVVSIKFRLVSDAYFELDGFYFDDIKLETISETVSNTNLSSNIGLTVSPNPFRDQINVIVDAEAAFKNIDAKLVNNLGQVVESKSINGYNSTVNSVTIDTAQLPEGVYYLYVEMDGELFQVKKMVK